MKKELTFPIKGTFYYGAFLAMDEKALSKGKVLQFLQEPDNDFDRYAIQIWLPNSTARDHKLLLGYVPKSLSKEFSELLATHLIKEIKVVHCAQHAKQIEIDCSLTIEQAWLPYARLYIQSFFVSKFYAIKRARQRWLAHHK